MITFFPCLIPPSILLYQSFFFLLIISSFPFSGTKGAFSSSPKISFVSQSTIIFPGNFFIISFILNALDKTPKMKEPGISK